ncbi:MAG: hypothetical protein ACRDIC_07230 [bacterium]
MTQGPQLLFPDVHDQVARERPVFRVAFYDLSLRDYMEDLGPGDAAFE